MTSLDAAHLAVGLYLGWSTVRMLINNHEGAPMNDHPARPSNNDDPDEALVRPAATRQSEWLSAQRGEPIEVPTNNDPRVVRRMLIDDRDAMVIALWALSGDGALTPDAVDVALADTTPAAAANMPYAVASAILYRVGDSHRCAVWDAIDVVLQRFDRTDRSAALAELAVHRIVDTVRSTITDNIIAEGSGAMLPDFSGPAPEPADQLASAAAFAATFAIGNIVERLRADLLALAGL